MGTSCISKPKHKKKDFKGSQIPSHSHLNPSSLQAMQICLAPEKEQLSQEFPYYPFVSNLTYSPNPQQILQIQQILWQKIHTLIHDLSLPNYIPLRMFSHSSIDLRKYFKHSDKYNTKELQWEGQCIASVGVITKISSLQAVFDSDVIGKIQYCPSMVLGIVGEQKRQNNKVIGEHILPVIYIKESEDKIKLTRMTNFEQICKLNVEKFQNPLTQVNKIDQNLLLNGLHWSKSQSTSKNSPISQFLRLFNLENNCQSELLLYINPCIKANMKVKGQWDYKYSTYLQLKASVERPCILDVSEMVQDWWLMTKENYVQPKIAISSIYILILSIKCSMDMAKNGNQIPEKILESLFHKQIKEQHNNDHPTLDNCLNIIRLIFFISIPNINLQQVELLCRRIIQDAIINSHILLQAYIIEFSMQVNQKQGILRQNPLRNRTFSFSYRQSSMRKANLDLINEIKTLNSHQIGQMQIYLQKTFTEERNRAEVIEKIQKLTAQWGKECLIVIHEELKIDEDSIMEDIKNQIGNQKNKIFSVNELLSVQSLFYTRILKFICVVGTTSNIFTHNICQLGCIGIIYQYWNPIFNQFLASHHTYCSGQLAIVILTFQGLIRSLDPDSNEEEEPYFLKAIQIWNRIYRDSLYKYKGYFPNNWICLIIKILLRNRYNSSEEKSVHQIHYLQNIYSCMNKTTDEGLMKDQQFTLNWILQNLPFFNISGIVYCRLDLMVDEDKSSTQLRTGGSFLDTPIDQLSNRSNFSETHSSGNNSLSKTRKKNRKKVNDSLSLLQHRTNTYGVYHWGKGVKSIPLLHTLTLKMDVFNISCGNYHVLIAAGDGIYGWGQNISGQLGQGVNHIPPNNIKFVSPMEINSKDDVELCCGNQHSAVLIKKTKELMMWGQKSGGIISGNGHKFDRVACGGLHTLGILDGQVFSWGRGQGGQLGQKIELLKTKKKQESTQFFLDSPTRIEGLKNIKKAVCGDAHSIVLSAQGQVFVFGFCYQGQLGLGLTGQSQTYQIFQPIPLLFTDKSGKNVIVDDIFAGPTFTFFKSTVGQLYSCGLNDYGQLGFEKVCKVFHKKKFISHTKNIKDPRLGQIQFSKPKKVDIFNKDIEIKQIFCGENHCLAKVQYIKNQQIIMGWGHNRSGQLSSEIPSQIFGPRTIDNLQDFHFDQICCGSNFSMALCRDPGLSQRQFTHKIDKLLMNISLSYKQ